jgi:hypothetical protein
MDSIESGKGGRYDARRGKDEWAMNRDRRGARSPKPPNFQVNLYLISLETKSRRT